LLSANQWRLQIERTLGRTHLGSGEAEILGRGRKAAMTQQIWMVRTSVPDSNRWTAKACRKE
jgi:hypothetical protein